MLRSVAFQSGRGIASRLLAPAAARSLASSSALKASSSGIRGLEWAAGLTGCGVGGVLGLSAFGAFADSPVDPPTPEKKPIAFGVEPSTEGADFDAILKDFQGTAQRPFAHVPTWTLLKHAVVLRICSIELVAEIAPKVLDLVEWLGLQTPFYKLISMTVAPIFMAGSTDGEAEAVCKVLRGAKVGFMLNFAKEHVPHDIAEVTPEVTRLMDGHPLAWEPCPHEVAANSEAAQSPHATYIDAIESFQKCANVAGRAAARGPCKICKAGVVATGYNYVVVKPTALIDPELLRKISVLVRDPWGTGRNTGGSGVKEGDVCVESFPAQGRIPPPACTAVSPILYGDDIPTDGVAPDLTLEEIRTHLSEEETIALDEALDRFRLVARSVMASGADSEDVAAARISQGIDPSTPLPGTNSLKEWSVAEAVRIGGKGVPGGARLAVVLDAERTDEQPAIDAIYTTLAREFNKERAVVYNTYQMYLRVSPYVLARHLEDARQLNYSVGCKLVRGAYLDGERKKAREEHREPPTQPSLHHTARAYVSAARLLLGRLDFASMILATHNTTAAAVISQDMHSMGIDPDDARVVFAQLYGMMDSLTSTAIEKRHRVVKYVPFGPMHVAIPYLVRRLQENSAVRERNVEEVGLMYKEIFERMLGRSDGLDTSGAHSTTH